jgi:predicted nucleotide-binding protein (sugar kinase/HSP70/actin superfamily)
MATKTTNGHTKQTQQKKRVYIPYMCDHGYALGAAMEAHGFVVEVLPPPDDETMTIGLELCKGKECLPCFTTTGDIIRRVRQPDFEPPNSVIMMPTTNGPCRFGQYLPLQQDILEQYGLDEVDFISPNAANSYQGFGDNPTKLRQLIWQGLVAIDMLERLLYEFRPYELNPGETDVLYQRCMTHVLDAVRAGGGKALINAMKWVAEQFEALPADRSQHRPVIGLVGEIYLRFNRYSNQNVIQRVEQAGGEVMVASMSEWIYFTNWCAKRMNWFTGKYFNFASMFLVDKYQEYQEHKVMKPIEHLLRNPHESSVHKLMAHIEPYYEPALATEAVMSLGRAIDYAKQGLSGIINVMPFSCMPGIITAGMAPRVRADLDHIPWLDISYDAQGGTNINTRLEAFMYQAIQYQRRTSGKPG